ncbi:gluconokinase [Xylanimonas sp. McL0601]|uniref:gluconokinase n=1 Tax=Xylanimonas sp. McL0601 TaxID=3414739 RepID=UPI003CF87816
MDVTSNPAPLIVVMGVAGSGKTTVAALLAGRLGAAFAEGDDFHSAANVAKMSAGHPLTDDDRWPWLRGIRDWLAEQHAAGRPAVVPCSALRRAYRDLLRGAGPVQFVHLTGSRELLAGRIQSRVGHYMKPEMLASQLATLEPLGPDEPGFTVDIAGRPERLVDDILAHVRGEANARTTETHVTEEHS